MAACIHSYYVSNDMVKLKHEENVDPFEWRMQLTSTSISLALILALQVRCTDPVVFDFYDVNVFVSKFWYINLQKLCFFENLFSCVEPFVYLIYFPAKFCLFATVTPFFAIILMNYMWILIGSVLLFAW